MGELYLQIGGRKTVEIAAGLIPNHPEVVHQVAYLEGWTLGGLLWSIAETATAFRETVLEIPTVSLPYGLLLTGERLYLAALDAGHIPHDKIDVVVLRGRSEPPLRRVQTVESLTEPGKVLLDNYSYGVFEVLIYARLLVTVESRWSMKLADCHSRAE